MLCLLVPHTHSRQIAPPTQVRWASAHVVGVGGDDMDEAFIQHPLRPILSLATERPGK